MLNKNITVLFSLLILLFTSCSRETKFDRDKWNAGDGLTFPNRNDMLNDLLRNQHLKGMKYYQVMGLLHRPQGGDSASMYYEIVRPLDVKSNYKKTLILYLGKDSVVTGIKVEESGKKI